MLKTPEPYKIKYRSQPLKFKGFMNHQPTSKDLTLDIFCQKVFHHLPLTLDDFAPLLKYISKKDYARKSSLLNAGDLWANLIYIDQGLIRLFYSDLDGRMFNKAFFGEGQCIWPVAPKDRDQGVLFSIAAVEDTCVYLCPFEALYEFLNSRGYWEKFALPFAETLIEQKFQREHDFLLLSAKERFENFSKSQPHLISRIPDYHLASYLGITNVSLSRIKRLVSH